MNPALDNFVLQIKDDFVFAQLLLRKRGDDYELRHVEDRLTRAENLTAVRIEQVRELAQFTAEGHFRPLKSAPTLRKGWKADLHGSAELGLALNQIYPGAIADWYALQRSSESSITHFREFTERQTGMYRITHMLTDEQAARVIEAGCHANVCLKRRLWTVANHPIDNREEKSSIPCLEPCALLLEFARKAMRLEQEEKVSLELPREEAADLIKRLENILANAKHPTVEADFQDPENPRRVRLMLGKLKAQLAREA
jgi:hypothetical protein